MKGKETLEEKDTNNKKTKKDNQIVVKTVPSDPAKHGKVDCASHRTLLALLHSITSSEADWPKEMLAGVVKRFGRMPRSGWKLATQYFCDKFKKCCSELDMKRRASAAIVDQHGRSCSQLKFRAEPVKRQKHADASTMTEMSIKDQELRIRTKQVFLECLEGLSSTTIDGCPWTPKIANELVDRQKLAYVNDALAQHLENKQPVNITDIAKLIQASQQAYQRVTAREKKPSKWQANILAKIDGIRSEIAMIEKLGEERIITSKDKPALLKTFRRLNISPNSNDKRKAAISLLEEQTSIYCKKLDMHHKRVEFRKANRSFELYRGRFYRSLGGPDKPHGVPEEDIKTFWNTMWNAEEKDENEYSQYLLSHVPPVRDNITFISEDEFGEIIKFLPNWKAAGVDGIYNFFIKYLPAIHKHLYRCVRTICLESDKQDEWFYTGITYLIPKGEPTEGSDFRPITCMSNLYKLTTKCVTHLIRLEVEERDLVSENQLGTVRYVQGAKEQAMINGAVNAAHQNELKTVWVDVKKAFDSVDHKYFMECIKSYNFQPWIVKFLEEIISNWCINIKCGRQDIMRKKIGRGILQGDSLSPLLFVLCMDPLSKKLNSKYPMVDIASESGSYCTNHLLFIDDLKLMAKEEETCDSMLRETLCFFKNVGLEVNKKKSATNTEVCSDVASIISGTEGYKYLGIVETAKSEVDRGTLKTIKEKILQRVQSLCETKLNGKNLMKSINEHAISLINYYVGVVDITPQECQQIDTDIRKVLMLNSIHKQPSNLERLYLPREELGRGLHNVEHRYESILLQLYETFDKTKAQSGRRNAILHIEEARKTFLYLIQSYVKVKYAATSDKMSLEDLKEHQRMSLYNEIKNKCLHEKLYSSKNNPVFSMKDSSNWLRRGNVSPKEEAAMCFFQDRNVFFGQKEMCPHCRQKQKTVDHLATRCDRMLSFDYTRRHNEVVRCIHAKICLKHGLRTSKKIRNHSIQEILSNKRVVVKVDTRIATDVKIGANKPDIFVHDKVKNEITLVEIGITNIDSLQTVELEKTRKYDLLAKELSLIHKCKVKVVPYVMTWDGLVTKYHKNHCKALELDSRIEAYIQSRVIKKTIESISLEHRQGLMEGGSGIRDVASIADSIKPAGTDESS